MDDGKAGGPSSSSGVERLGQLALLLLFLFALAGGIALLVQQGRPGGVEVTLPTATPAPSVQVYVTGAVARPGVYTLQEGDRLQDAVDRAGGADENADLARVNLAAHVRDQDHHHIPMMGEEAAAAPTPESDTPSRTNLNRAGLEELMALPGIGEVRAQSILDHRRQNGPFQSVESLVDVSGIGWTTLERIRPLVTVE